jgi:hypothetical protein
MGVSYQFHFPAALPPGKEPPGTHWIRRWLGPRIALDVLLTKEKVSAPTGNGTQILRPSRLYEGTGMTEPRQKSVRDTNYVNILISVTYYLFYVLLHTFMYIAM